MSKRHVRTRWHRADDVIMNGMLRLPTIVLLALVPFASEKVFALGEEDFGNQKLIEANYPDWKNIMPLLTHGERVYHFWVNGSEGSFYRGDDQTLNEALEAFAQVECKAREVLLRPGPGVTHTFDGKKIDCDWDVQINGGISKHLTTLPKGNLIWSESPAVTVYVGPQFELSKVKIPDGVSVVELSDLKARNRQALTSDDKTVRGWGAGHLARLDEYDDESLATIVKILKEDKDDWVKQNAAGAISTFGAKAKSALPALRKAMETKDEALKKDIERAIEEIGKAPDKSEAEREHRAMVKKIHEFRERFNRR
jgi:hypothetical protein